MPSALITRWLAARVVPVVYRQDALEGDFRVAHNRLMTHAESVAFYGGQNCEHRQLSG